ncbi:MAG: hypothetical protein A4E53_03881 [Pelotomaculum sp. PtaB.Bin104]|nr:MAG: hypothetical protein A4E53_03881 [Pelotomaculum sp. PtaB.Bin104]
MQVTHSQNKQPNNLVSVMCFNELLQLNQYRLELAACQIVESGFKSINNTLKIYFNKRRQSVSQLANDLLENKLVHNDIIKFLFGNLKHLQNEVNCNLKTIINDFSVDESEFISESQLELPSLDTTTLLEVAGTIQFEKTARNLCLKSISKTINCLPLSSLEKELTCELCVAEIIGRYIYGGNTYPISHNRLTRIITSLLDAQEQQIAHYLRLQLAERVYRRLDQVLDCS